jgi:hypothetical protein
MKFKTTKKEIMANYSNVIRVGYCGLQNLLNYKNPIAYTSGSMGWNADIYEINANTVMVTGYAPFGNFMPNREIVEKYENLSYNATSDERETLIKAFVHEVLK